MILRTFRIRLPLQRNDVVFRRAQPRISDNFQRGSQTDNYGDVAEFYNPFADHSACVVLQKPFLRLNAEIVLPV